MSIRARGAARFRCLSSVRRACSTAVESLERRQLFSATLDGGVWLIRGESGSDVIVVEAVPGESQTLRAVINGEVAGTAPIAGLLTIDVDARAGHDHVTLRLDSTVTATVITAGGDGNDRLIGSSLSETLFGGAGDDRIDAGAGNDTLYGDAGNDSLSGGDGDDQLFGGDGTDVLAGGFGVDKLDGGTGKDRLGGGHDADTLFGDRGADMLSGGKGVDAMDGGKGRDRVYTEKGVDLVGPIGSASPRKNVAQDRLSVEDTHEATVRQTTDAELKQWLIDAAVKQWSWAFGKPANPWIYYWGHGGEVSIRGFAGSVTDGSTPPPAAPPAAPSPAAPGGPTGSGGESTDHSSTNTQVAGVDEADLVETDGSYIYSLQDDELIIADASPADAMNVVARRDFDGIALGIYLSGNRLTMLTGSLHYWINPPLPVDSGVVAQTVLPPSPAQDPFVTVTVLDVSNPAGPAVVETTRLDGSYGESRLMGDQLYLVMRNDAWVPEPQKIPNPEPPPQDDSPPSNAKIVAPDIWPPGGYSDTVYETEASYRARLEAMPLQDLLPGYESSAGGSQTSGPLVTAPNAYVRDLGDSEIGQNLTTVTLLDVGDAAGGPVATSTVAGYGGAVYASGTSLYLAGTTWTDDGGESTRLFKFGLNADSVPLLATGTVDGGVLNQFGMDEFDDTFRIATNDGWRTDAANHLYVLEQMGDKLETIGSIKNIAKGEDLQSVRFDGSRAYIVTFLRVDPLFTVDLTNPTSPKIAGELKIPGYSSYLQPIGDGLLLGIGRDIDDDGINDKGLQLSLFDVSNLSSPTRIAKYTIEDGYSEAEYDHHAFSYFSDQQILAVPVAGYDDGDYRQELAVLKVDAAAKAFTLLGNVAPPSEVRRSLRIGDALFAVASKHIQTVQLQNPGVVIKTLPTSA